MKCPECGFLDDKVLETRPSNEGRQVRRRRECLSCEYRYTTVEEIQRSLPLVIKKDGRRESYSPDKILRGVELACHKRPISAAQIENLVQKVSDWVASRGLREIRAQDIGSQVVREIKQLDDVAYVRFAAVYETFRSIDEFMSTLESSNREPESKSVGPGSSYKSQSEL